MEVFYQKQSSWQNGGQPKRINIKRALAFRYPYYMCAISFEV
jgi:hypothetical protein